MIPDAIITLTGGSVAEQDPQTGKMTYRSTTYADGDAFGALGGLARVQATARLARQFPRAFVVTTSRRDDEQPTHARVAADELVALGVPLERIILEELSVNTKTQVEESLRIARKRGWERVFFMSNEYQLERVRAFVERLSERPMCEIAYQSAEEILVKNDPAFATEFARIKASEPYRRRLVSEARGLAAIRRGDYRAAPAKDKRERQV